MASCERIGLYTTPSTWVNGFNTVDTPPYRRIVGIEHGSGMPSLTWARFDPRYPETEFSRADSAHEVIEMPAVTAARLVGFFERFFAEEPRKKPVYDTNGLWVESLEEGYNCHRFGYWMKGAPIAQQFDIPDAPDFMTERPAFTGNLPMGRHGVLGTVGAAVHSVVGLGEDRNECLQVLASQGHIGIDSYENIVDQYDYMRTRGMQFFA